MLFLVFKNKSFNVELVRKFLANHDMFKTFSCWFNFQSHLGQINSFDLIFKVFIYEGLIRRWSNVILKVVAASRKAFNFSHVVKGIVILIQEAVIAGAETIKLFYHGRVSEDRFELPKSKSYFKGKIVKAFGSGKNDSIGVNINRFTALLFQLLNNLVHHNYTLSIDYAGK